MSMAEDYDWYDPFDCEPDINLNDKTWTDKNGNTMYIFEMTNQHLLRTIKLIEKKGYDVPYEMLREKHIRKLTDKDLFDNKIKEVEWPLGE